ncbi:carcinoembryonic antigen-related cell adhesion molecule 21-like [Peromyscus eremicus]|uniref:carcinoembryonic antigen-related cell adhesion molecule 21-like n=1 Tax=Peromyscus eremicus TaxID=42410 RepID=UPI0027DB4ED0|nr:carcinoembryonic antigen-related cell adhesion molecule 21-like [Peromyscus eremicus]
MELITSAPLHIGQVSWRGLLLTALLLAFWNFATTAELTVEAVPPHAGEGDQVLFLAHNVPETQRFFNWFRGNRLNMSNSIIQLITHRSKIEKGPLYSERETIYTDESLLFKNVTKKDAGVYLLVATTEDLDEKKATLQLYVHDPVTLPSIQVTNTTVKDLTSIFLTCLSNDTDISIHWLFNSQRLRITNKMMLSPNNSTLQIDPARSENSGDYQCEVTKGFVNKRSDRITLNIIDPVTLPFIQVTNTTVKNMISVFLTCLSNDTDISIHWLFKGQSVELTDRVRLSQNNSTLQIDSVRSEDSGDYQCKVSNQISSKRSDPIQLDIKREPPKPKKHRPSSRGIIGIVAQCLMGLIAVIVVLFFLWRSRHGR